MIIVSVGLDRVDLSTRLRGLTTSPSDNTQEKINRLPSIVPLAIRYNKID